MLTVSLVVVITAAYLVILAAPAIGFLEALFEVVSAFVTCVLSPGTTGKLSVVDQVAIMLMMFWGWPGALTIVAALVTPRHKTLITYPETTILNRMSGRFLGRVCRRVISSLPLLTFPTARDALLISRKKGKEGAGARHAALIRGLLRSARRESSLSIGR